MRTSWAVTAVVFAALVLGISANNHKHNKENCVCGEIIVNNKPLKISANDIVRGPKHKLTHLDLDDTSLFTLPINDGQPIFGPIFQTTTLSDSNPLLQSVLLTKAPSAP